jgi:hypothetical protein
MKIGRVQLQVALVVLAGVALGQAAPEPKLDSDAWQLEFDFHDLQRLNLVLPGDREPTSFWYLLYTVTNSSGQDVGFYPTFDLVTNTLEVVEGGRKISPSVYDAISARHKKLYPFFRPPTQVMGKLLEGVDNARTSAAVFRDFDPEASSFRLYIAGLSGEIETVLNPGFDPDQPESVENQRSFILRKTLEITYDLPGDPQTRNFAVPQREATAWVMR